MLDVSRSSPLTSDIQHLTSALMKLAAESQTHIQNFFRSHLRDETLELPSVSIYGNRFAGLLTGVCRVGGITFGRRIFVAPSFIKRNETGRLTIPGWLVAHEAMHMLQYKEHGTVGFLACYLHEFWQRLRETKRWDRAARMTAYLAIAEECVARAAEDAYCAWSGEDKDEG